MSRFNSRHWLAISALESSFACPEMRLLGRLAEVLATGAGKIFLDSFGDFHFELAGKTTDLEGFEEFVSYHQQNPYDGLARFRLVVVDASGQEIHCGYTASDDITLGRDESLRCSGPVEGLILDSPGFAEIGTEILVLVPERHWLSEVLTLSFPPADENGVSKHSMDLLGSSLEFEYERKSRSFTVSVTGGDAFPQTYTEGWLSEPLRMMLGQLVFPRVIVRANPDRAIVMVPQIRFWHREGDGYSLLDPATTFDNRTLFFDMYAELLKFVATARNAKGEPNFERHPLTKFYEELAQAMRGSRWIMTLTLASSIEGALDLIFPTGAQDETANPAELKDLKQHIDKWAGHPTSSVESVASLKDRAKGAVSFSATLTAIKRLRHLASKRVVASDEVGAWDKVRNQVTHGKIFSPFSSEENDRIIINLMTLFRRIADQITLGRKTD